MSVNGCIIPGTPIAVDFWQIRGVNPDSFLFFLTHLHGDHIVGLTSTWRHLIYCSLLTAELLHSLYGVDKSLLHPLEVGQAHLVPVPTRDAGESSFITVSVIDANHCPGAVMFIFEGEFGKIFHTGDFRYTSDLVENSILSNHRGSIDVLYLDNTFCHPQCTFPTQHEARMTILKIIEQHRDCNVVLGMRNLGKEELLVWLALSLHEWISVTGKMYNRIQTLGLPNVFKIGDKSLRIRVEPFRLVSKKMLRLWNEEVQTIAILPTAIFTGIGGIPFANQHNIFVVPYSDHSSYVELTEFVSKVRPCSVVPIVSSVTRGPFGVDISSRADMSCFDDYCRHTDDKTIRKAVRTSNFPCVDVARVCTKQRTVKRKRFVVHKKITKGVEYDSDDGDTVVRSSDGLLEQNNNHHYSGAELQNLKPRHNEPDDDLKYVNSTIDVTDDVSKDACNKATCLDRPNSDVHCDKCTPDLCLTKSCDTKSNILNKTKYNCETSNGCLSTLSVAASGETKSISSNKSQFNCSSSSKQTSTLSLPKSCDMEFTSLNVHISESICDSSEKSMSNLFLTKQELATENQQTDVLRTIFPNEQNMVIGSIRESKSDCGNHNTNSLKESYGHSVQNMSCHFNILEKYSVKSLSRDQSTKKLVAALNKWLSDP